MLYIEDLVKGTLEFIEADSQNLKDRIYNI